MPLEGPDRLHLRAAGGYVGLGMFEEANAELEEIDPFCRHLPEVRMARLAIYYDLTKWDLLAVVAKRLAEWHPDATIPRARAREVAAIGRSPGLSGRVA